MSRYPFGAGLRFPAPIALGQLARELGGSLDSSIEGFVVDRLAPVDFFEDLDQARALAPVLAPAFVRSARRAAALLLVAEPLARDVPAGRRWIHPFAQHAMARLLARCEPARPKADIHATARVGPGAVVYDGVVIGEHSTIEPNVVLYPGVRVGARVSIGACSVLGRPGFGWAPSPSGEAIRVPQLAGVIVEDDVEIGPLSTIDAGTLAPTVIERGAKLDAHVHVGHNALVGAGSLVAAQAGFAGSARLGKGCLVGGQAGFADHVEIGDGARIAAKAGVIGDVPPGRIVAGYPAVERGRWLRATARALREIERPRRKAET